MHVVTTYYPHLQAFGLHGHEAGANDHAHSEVEGAGKGEELAVVWRACVVILGMYAFFLFEFVLHSWAGHSHSATPTENLSHSDSAQVGHSYSGSNRV